MLNTLTLVLTVISTYYISINTNLYILIQVISSYVTYISYTQITVFIYKLISDIFYCSIALIIKLEDCLNS
ncbi:hypothetical protein BDF21DRAFT_405258 [Thamnidium elegans]|nr:hypothetical protein BDF21DRAFT_405245 [Thamnidium elegans]KAI8095134.1 hypothetical protein BDF21DRAFT_405258 [Thamnidium elegans]